ncbi:FAD-dependent oxidoreductase [Bradyrhizobium sp. LTSP849]|uniref:NAD(P)/FAD-dependent oxidoreductase n=1 Tax=unclassified Bradyrhizobium TaxID=2631580 RepID=UPI0005D1863D|nr:MULTISPECIES: FAD-dependent oxidoreductase [unclassified Bradyrhizobium]KJC34210.1 FAD-dependent oxidoreductase [Bradyrhizobium sp. LTSP849]KJC50737.1 FAD-dependent oxidoreductase [Bradyrhizobium sp. LTSP857]
MTHDYDIAVIGGGLVGTAIAYGLAKTGQRVALLDEDDRARRASVANFSLIWVQTKGLGMPEYSDWSRGAADLWPDFRNEIAALTGIDLAFSQPGGFHLCLSEAEVDARASQLARINVQAGMSPLPYEILGHNAVREMLPDIGPEVVGASYCPLDGQCNSMRLFWGLHTAFARLGGHYRSDHRVESLTASEGGFVASTAVGSVAAGKVVIAAGNDSRRLGAMVGIDAQVRPQRGQVLVTERMKPFLHYPTITVRQADEGSVMLGDAIEEENPSLVVGTDVLAKMADRARRMFPGLSKVNIVRTWAAQRVMTKDGCPIYDESREHPGAFVANCHSGVTLAPRHAQTLAPLIASSRVKAELPAFGTGRFDVSTVH